MVVKKSRKQRRARKKKNKKLLKEQELKIKLKLEEEKRLASEKKDEPTIEVEPLIEEIQTVLGDVFTRFTKERAEKEDAAFQAEFKNIVSSLSKKAQESKKAAEKQKASTMETEGPTTEEKPLSNRQKKDRRRLKIAELKQLVARPDLVEEHDCNASDPRLLIFLKCQRNSITVPEHWGRKRKYLQGKRGFEKPPFELPAFIKNTGITAIRDEQLRIYSEKTRKQKQRATRSGARGKMAIDYQTLHDAFFVHQTKPPLTSFGDIYYEQKEKEMKFRSFNPGKVSDRLKKALGMPATWKVIAPGGIPVYDDLEEDQPREGQILAQGTELSWDETSGDKRWIKIVRPVNGWIQCKDEGNKVFSKQMEHNCPTPWLIAQQRFGPPPAYPDLKIPGLNAPIPAGHEYGYGEGQWGKPPIGGDGQPLYGNPFGMYFEPDFHALQPKEHWGDLEDISDDEDSSDESASEDEEMEDGIKSTASGIVSGVTSGVNTGMVSASSQSENEFNLRKKAGTDTAESQKALYTVLQQQDTSVQGNLFGSTHRYDLKNMEGEKEESGGARGVEVTLDAQDMMTGTLDEHKLKRKYEEGIADRDEIPLQKRRRSRFDQEYDVKF